MLELAWLSALFGGVLIGLSAVLMMATLGRIAGISGMTARLLTSLRASSWQGSFLLGLVISGVLVHWLYAPITVVIEANKLTLVVSGLLVGFGTLLARGCTSGHGVCGMARVSLRSVTATVTFVGAGMLTVALIRSVVELAW